MKKSGLLLAAVIFAALFFFKTGFPEASSEIIGAANRLVSGAEEYLSVFSGMQESTQEEGESEAVQVYNEGEGEEKPLQSGRTEQAKINSSEAGVNSGESRPEPKELPAAVTAFLESQEPYSDYALPENVSYDYSPFDEETAVPVAGYNSSGFGYRLHPIKGEVRFHYGTDFAAWSGEEILAFAAGTVSFAGQSDSYGNYIKIDHGNGWESLYSHCSKLFAAVGDTVAAGDKIALVGDTGLTTGPHLHFELSKDGVYVNPEYYVN